MRPRGWSPSGGRRSLVATYRTPPGAYLRGLPRAARRRFRAFVTARSPVHYEGGDMRGTYRATGTAVALGVGLAVVLPRVALTGLFVAYVSPDAGQLAAFNLVLSVLAGGLVLGVTRSPGRGRPGRRLRAVGRRLRPRRPDEIDRL